ncbi:ABC transporter ATP-binding protein [Arthrobacter sp. KFRI-F3372]|nr:ABC transporter ATP-binding protein [Arthrobacter sp. KFRI-F3372]
MTDMAIETDRLTKRYGNAVTLDALTLRVPEGEIFGLLGHNGAGETTTVNILTTLLPPSSGTARIGGHDLGRGAAGVRRSIGYLPENVQFYGNLTLEENLLFFAGLSGVDRPRAAVEAALEAVHFTGFGRQRMETFSKGMRQRAGIAQAILHAPAVLFLDEPTSGLDPQGVAHLREVIIGLNREFGMTIFMSTHLLAEVTRTCTSIGILSSGSLIYQNSVAATLQSFPDQESLEEIYLRIEAGAVP